MQQSLHRLLLILYQTAKGETEVSNIDLAVEGIVNVFLTQPVLVFCVSHMGDCLGRGAE